MVTPDATAAPPVYQGWRAVPDGLHTRTQLADLDLPRVPAGLVRARVQTSDWRGKKVLLDLYALAESEPSSATIGHLEAARRRAGGGRVCGGCGARPDRPLIWVNGRHLCRLCTRIRQLREFVDKASAERVDVVRWARQILADRPAVVLRVQTILRPPAPSGRQDASPVALRVDAVDVAGRRLVDTTIRTAGPRVRAVPPHAVDPDTVAEQIRTLLATPVIVTWSPSEDTGLRRLYGADPLRMPVNRNDLGWRVRYWRGDVDPDAAGHFIRRPAIHPGRADRMLLLIRRMAATEIPDGPS
ncbi:hypothetical protein E1091_10245 [Micromonospora fluostatini]|uniref:GATA-type domain-containing protein n=1 Tax=Micromonospora fluostatini TaxID=1629071 RepID=A0ABY2DGT3_9ACTN|nr:hypothetical protein E1091_10245 [Micromonospora fluostatini]